MTAFRKFIQAEDGAGGGRRITRRCGGETAAAGAGVNDRWKSTAPCRWWIRLGAFDADQILACVLSIGSPTPRRGAARPALANPIEYSITAGRRGTGRATYIRTLSAGRPTVPRSRWNWALSRGLPSASQMPEISQGIFLEPRRAAISYCREPLTQLKGTNVSRTRYHRHIRDVCELHRDKCTLHWEKILIQKSISRFDCMRWPRAIKRIFANSNKYLLI